MEDSMLKKTLFSSLLFSALLVPGVFVFGIFAVSCSWSKEPSEAAASMERLYAEQGRPVSVRRLESEDFSVYLKYPTIVYAASESTAYAELADVVRSISAKVGDTVRQDDIIVSFSAANQSLRLATLAHEAALVAFNRSSALFENNDISRQDYEQVRTQYEIARADLKAANDMVYVKAPISGTITWINVHVTENVYPGMPLFTVSGRGGYEARFYVGASEIDRIQTRARAFINDPSEKIEGRVTQVSFTMDSQRQAFPVTAFFETVGNKLVSGMGVDLSVETYRNEKAIVLFRQELIETNEGYTAFVADQNTARQVAVTVGYQRGLRLVVASGLSEGDMLISEGARSLRPNEKINVVKSALVAAER
jgi:RND family efflux transporter MFP subunit